MYWTFMKGLELIHTYMKSSRSSSTSRRKSMTVMNKIKIKIMWQDSPLSMHNLHYKGGLISEVFIKSVKKWSKWLPIWIFPPFNKQTARKFSSQSLQLVLSHLVHRIEDLTQIIIPNKINPLLLTLIDKIFVKFLMIKYGD